MTTEESPENRAAYIEALKAERDNVDRRPTTADTKRRLADIDAELDNYSDAPSSRKRQTAAKKAPAKKAAAPPAEKKDDAGSGAAGGGE